MEPLRASDPKQIGSWTLVGRLWSAGPITSYLASGDAGGVELQTMDVTSLDDDAIARLRDSAERLGGLQDVQSARLQGFHAFGVEAGTAWLALDPPQGRPLDDVVSGGGPLQEGPWLALAETLVAVLSSCRASGIVHGNIVPGSARIDEGAWSIANPGLPSAGVMAGIPVPGVLARSLMWLSPEQVTGAAPSPDSDLFAAGSVLAFAATGSAPWGDTATPTTEVIRRISQDPAPLGELPWEQAGLIAALTAKDPAYRLSNVDAWQAEQALRAAPVEPVVVDQEPITVVESANSPGSDEDATSAGDVVAESSSDDVTERSGDDDSAPEWPATNAGTASRRRTPLIIGGAVAVVLALVVGGIALSGGSDEEASTDATSASSPSSEASVSASPTPQPPVYTTKINYAARSIPDKSFEQTLDWSFDVCSGDTSLAEKDVLEKVVVSRKSGSTWSEETLQPRVESPGRCAADEVNLLIDGTEVEPAAASVGKGWLPCVNYRVTLPESAKFAKTNVDFCVQVKADEADAA